jgi:hypothetical protein
MTTVVIQSFHDDPPAWIVAAMASVRAWADGRGFIYRHVGDEIFERVSPEHHEKAGPYPQIATDLGRLALAREALAEGYARAVWLDADVAVFAPERLNLAAADRNGYAFGREIWVQPARQGRTGLEVRRNVHNAICVFDRENPFLAFYEHAAKRLLDRVEAGRVAPQIVGPKLLASLHNTVALPLIEACGMASPLVVRDLAAGGGPALALLRSASPVRPAALNLCHSLSHSDGLDEAAMEAAVERLLAHGVS